MNKEIILVRFHKKPLVVKNRVKLLKKFNPNMEVYGLYGGDEAGHKSVKRYLRKDFVHIYKLKEKYQKWAWYNGDLAVREWFRNYGKKLDFDRVYLVEWDALIFAPLKEVYKDIPRDSLGLTWLRRVKDVQDSWYWTSTEPWKSFWLELLARVKEKYNYNGDEKVCVFGLPVFPRKFLENYSQIGIETIKYNGQNIFLAHDEIRLPLYAEILGYNMVDTDIMPLSYKEEERFFNANDIEIERETILAEMVKSNGKRIFHPFRKIYVEK